MINEDALIQPRIGIVGFGAFGRLIAESLLPYATVTVADKSERIDPPKGVAVSSLTDVCSSGFVILATPVSEMREVCRTIAPLLRPGTLVMDVGSVKMKPARILVEELPEHVELAATHPMFGPQSIRSGVPLKIVICPLRGRRIWRAGAFLRHQLGMSVIISTPEDHDREAAYTQGLFHFIAGGMLRLDHAPKRITTPSFDLLRKAVDMVRHDAAAVSSAIELENPFAEAARAEFVWHLEAVRLRKDSATAHE